MIRVIMQYHGSKHRGQSPSLQLMLIGGMGLVVEMVSYSVFLPLLFKLVTHWWRYFVGAEFVSTYRVTVEWRERVGIEPTYPAISGTDRI